MPPYAGAGPGRGHPVVARCWAGFASLGAGLVHLAVVREHLDHWPAAGALFAVLGAAQLGWGLAALARDRAPFPVAFAGLNLAVVGLWALSRTVGLPVGPDAGRPEPAGTADVLCAALQALVVAALLLALRTGRGAVAPASARRPGTGRVLVGLGAGALVMSALTTPALAATESGEHARPHGSHGLPHGDGPAH